MTDLKKLTRKESCELLSTTYRNFTNWKKEDDPPPASRNGRTYDGAKLVQWFVARALSRAKQQGAESPEAARYLEKYRKERFKLARMDRLQRQGELVNKAEVVSQWTARVVLVVSGLQAWVDRLPGLLVGKGRDEIRAILKAEVRTLQENYARVGRYTPEVNE